MSSEELIQFADEVGIGYKGLSAEALREKIREESC